MAGGDVDGASRQSERCRDDGDPSLYSTRKLSDTKPLDMLRMDDRSSARRRGKHLIQNGVYFRESWSPGWVEPEVVDFKYPVDNRGAKGNPGPT